MHERWLARFTAQGHQPRLEESGEIDHFVVDFDDYESGGGHNGPGCSRCDFSFCEHCDPDGKDIPPCEPDKGSADDSGEDTRFD